MFSLRVVCLAAVVAACALVDHSAAYQGGHNWGYKTEIHHPAKSSYGYNNGHGYSRVERYQSSPKHYEHKEYYKSPKSYYKSSPKYYKPSKYEHHEEEHYEMEKPHYYKKPSYKPYKPYYPPPPPPTTTPPPKKEKEDDDHLGLKFNFEMPMKKIFEKFGKEEKEETTTPEPDPYGYGEKTTPKEEEEEEKKFDIKIPKIDIEKMIPSFKS